ncbi:hypothetical protein, partial [Micromonospora aurantiaca (nom. illeg.)]|uniref:hypothetical protein n=1 Tax=Micromonospora aurantiaca (nom. illeg.) TaxID=47850 RepID=UPI003800F4ED
MADLRPGPFQRLDQVRPGGPADVTGSDLLRPEHATVAGVVRSVPLERQGLRCHWVDADPAEPGADALADELL